MNINALNTLTVRPSDLILERIINPTQVKEYKKARAIDMVESCGVIPDFFAEACLDLSFEDSSQFTLDNIANKMDLMYQFGGFLYPMGGAVAEDGVYVSSYDDDDDLAPICRYKYEDKFYLYVYEYAITAIVDIATGDSKIARFD